MAAHTKAYNGLEQFSKAHQFLIRCYIAYLFLIPGISMFFHDQYFDHAPGWTLAAFLLITVIHLGFVINNFQVPKTAFRTLLMILRLPLEFLVISLWQNWSPEMALASLYTFEIIGFSLGLTTGVIFKKANIKMTQRIVSFLIASAISICAVFRFSGVLTEILHSTDSRVIISIVLGVTVLTSVAPYAQMFISGKDGEGLNMGTSNLTQRLGKYLALAMLANIVLMVLGLNL